MGLGDKDKTFELSAAVHERPRRVASLGCVRIKV